MNLLDRIKSISTILKPGFILMIPVFFGCETSDDIGIQYDLASDANVKFVELNISSSNIYVDSLRTDGENAILVGNYNDEIGGEISAEGYFALSYLGGPLPRAQEFLENDTLPDGSIVKVLVTPEDTLELDSIRITFEASSSIANSENALQDFQVFQLQDSLISSAIYLSSLRANTSNSIGSYSMEINTRQDTIFRLSATSEFSNSFFELLSEIARDSTRTIRSEVFQSFGLVPSSGSNSISNLDLVSDTSRLLIYSSPIDSGMRDSTYVTSFRFNSKNYSYLDRSKTNFSALADGSEVTLPEGIAMLDPLYGISPRISIAELINFIEENDRIIINNASLSFEISEQFSRDTLENFYSFFYKNNNFNAPGLINDPFSNLIMSDDSFLTGQVSPSISFINDEESALLVDATLFFQTLYNDYIAQSETSDVLIREVIDNQTQISLIDFILLSLRNVTIERSTFNGDGVRLRIYYTEVDQ